MVSDNAIGTAVIVLLVIGSTWLAFGPEMIRYFRDRNLLANGEPASGRLITIRDTGNRFNENPEVAMVLEVELPGGGLVRAELMAIVSTVDLPRYQPGATVALRYD